MLATLGSCRTAVDHDEVVWTRPGEPHPQLSRFTVLAHNRELVIFGAVVAFHFANAAMLPLVGCWCCTIETKERRWDVVHRRGAGRDG